MSSLAIGNTAFNEGDTGTTIVNFTVTRSGSTTGTASATYAINNGSATDSDFAFTAQNPRTGTVTFADGQSTATIGVPVRGDFTIENNESFTVTLSSPTNATIATATGTGTILNDDAGGGFSVADVTVAEGDTLSAPGFFTVTRTNGTGAATIDYTISDGGRPNSASATRGVDYGGSQSGTITFAGGQTTARIQFSVIGDTNPEQNEQLRLTLSNPSEGSITNAMGYATIVDNDAPVGSQFGTDGDDTLISNTPGAALVGGNGNDTYLVNNALDTVIEQTSGGTDIVYSTVSYNLGVNEVETLSTVLHVDTAAINLIGNFGSQRIIGNYGDNVLNGGSGGLDTLIGLFGNDVYAVGSSATVIQEQDGQGFDTVVTAVDYTLAAGVSVELFAAQDRSSTTGLRLSGNEFAQTIAGTEGADTISGGGGMDTLFGGGGADLFVMSGPAAGNVDVIGDFNAGGQADRIGLSTGFEALGATLDANEFVMGTTAVGTNAQVIYDQASGQLFYDADGTGTGAAVLFATIAPGSALDTTNFTMLAAATPTA